MADTPAPQHWQILELSEDASAFDLERAYLRKSSAARMAGRHDEIERLKTAFETLKPWVAEREKSRVRRAAEQARDRQAEQAWQELEEQAEPDGGSPLTWDPRSFDSLWISLLAPLLVVGVAWLVQLTPLGFLLRGFHVWIHEFGHATVAWMSGYKALPLPFGWTNISPAKVDFVYWGVLFLLGVFAVAGWRERRIWPLILAPLIALAQWWMTWQVPEWRIEMWIDFAGVGGEFYLSAAMMAAFFISLPEKFRWGSCRYLFLFLGAATFIDTYGFWRDVYVGLEEIPWGTMIHGEGDEGGDMNKLRDGWGWSRQRIYRSYNALGHACLLGLGIVYAMANLANLLKWKSSLGGRERGG